MKIETDKLPVVCAWCQRVRQEDGSYKVAPHPPLASHGICLACKASVERDTLSGTDERRQ